MELDRTVALAAGGILGGAVGYFVGQQITENVKAIVTQNLDFTTLLNKLYWAFWKTQPDAAGATYWLGRFTSQTDTEFTTNKYSGTSIPISASGTKPAILAILIARSL